MPSGQPGSCPRISHRRRWGGSSGVTAPIGTRSSRAEEAMPRMTGGGALVEMLRRHQVDTIFALPGVQNDALFVAFYDAGEALRVIHTRHEQGAAYMAFGYARASGKVGAY